MKFFTGNALWQLLAQSDWVSWAVILILLSMSIFCWAIAIYKFQIFNRKNKQLHNVLLRLSAVNSLEQLLIVGQQVAQTLPGAVITRSLARAQFLLGEHQGLKKTLSSHDMELLRSEVDSLLDELIVQEEQQVPFLKTCAEAGPLLGLFGTIWGLIHAFVRISQEQNADIVTVAPGIAEALITTLVGLIVAIPALILFNMLQARVQHIEHQLMMVADRCLWVIQTTLQNREL